MKELAQFIKILGDTNRLAIIFAIGNQSLSVTEIITETGLSQTLVSFHLRAMRSARVVQTHRDGPFIFYNLTDLQLINILGDLAQIAGLDDIRPETSVSLQIAHQR
ncbi:MAG: metalloregulator ArsR/SmtB family transcription factor [Proteobacteria bacterium]|nr:metalloregulator ArsR/SmtB family transcription factor [Pseudomonadota bacterium]MBU1709349.1 metalloregulator ArsR/SmtB family transcription factor [Pseudomonadota bacterium]